MKLTEKSQEIFDYIKNGDGKVSIPEMAAHFGRTDKSIGANVTDLQKKGLCVRVKETVGEETITYAVLTDEGINFVPTEE